VARAAVFEQLGEPRLEAAVTTDVAGAGHAHALRLDEEATPDVKKARLHRKVATVVFFESNGGQQRGEATRHCQRLRSRRCSQYVLRVHDRNEQDRIQQRCDGRTSRRGAAPKMMTFIAPSLQA
jgi:hypothetical protein